MWLAMKSAIRQVTCQCFSIRWVWIPFSSATIVNTNSTEDLNYQHNEKFPDFSRGQPDFVLLLLGQLGHLVYNQRILLLCVQKIPDWLCRQASKIATLSGLIYATKGRDLIPCPFLFAQICVYTKICGRVFVYNFLSALLLFVISWWQTSHTTLSKAGSSTNSRSQKPAKSVYDFKLPTGIMWSTSTFLAVYNPEHTAHLYSITFRLPE